MSSAGLLNPITGGSDSTSIGSGGEIESTLTPWLGPPNQFAPLDLDVDGKNPHITHNLPMAYWGKSKAMEAIIEFRMVNKSEWYTSELMPWKRSDNVNFSWMVFKYDKSFFEVEPYGGNPNYIQSGQEAYSDRMIQRGMAFTIAHAFWQTERGQQEYRMNFEVLESSAQLTIYHLIIMAILKAKNVYRNWELRFKNPVTTIPQALKKMKLRWAILNKGMHLFRQFHADLVEQMEVKGVKPNLWALPPKSKILMSHMHDSEYDYNQAGPISQKVRKEGQPAYDSIRGVKIHETTVFNEIMFSQAPNPLRRVREYGSFFWLTNYHGGAHLDTYKNEDRFAAKILDASKDGQETKVSAKILFRLSQRFAADGFLSGAHQQIIQDNTQNDLRRRLGDRPDNNYLDMFIGFDPSRDSQNPYYVMDYLGEMWEMDVQKHQVRDFAATACNKLTSLSEDELKAIDDASRFMDDLNNVDFSIPEHKIYWDAVRASIVTPNAENANPQLGSGIAKNNGDGCIMPPFLGDEISIKVGGKITSAFDQGAKELKDVPPLGFGSPPGLKTLAGMLRRGEDRGYSQTILEEAAHHYATMTKFHGIWKNMFPEHELGKSSACPYYFRSGSTKNDEVTAFALNLYDHARYPVFVVTENATTAKDTLSDAKTPTAFLELIGDGLAEINKSGTSITQRLAVFVSTNQSGEVREALSDPGIKRRLGVNYRNKPYVKDGTSLSVGAFLATVFTLGTMGTDDEAVSNVMTRVLEILLRDGYNEQVNWATELNIKNERPIKINNFLPFQKGVAEPLGTSTNSGEFAINSRLCINPDCFRRIAETAGSLDSTSTDIGAYFDLPVRPMNIFNPNRALGLVDTSGVKARTAATKKEALMELRFASAPQSANTASSITTSPVFAKHLDGLSSVSSAASSKRNLEDNFSSSSAGPRKRVVGGTLMSQGMPYEDTTSRLFGGVPVSTSAYVSTPLDAYTESTDPSASGTIPINIALSEAYKVFTFESTHQDIAGGIYRDRHYRSTLVARFHDWADEQNKCHRIFAQSWITSRIKRQTFEAFWAQDIIPLVSFELWRIKQRYYMGSGFLAEGGSRLGNAMHGFHDFQWTDDIIRKVHVGHYTFLFAAPVKDPKMVALCEDIVAMGHIGGEDVTFIEGPEGFNLLCTDPDNADGCILVKMVPYNRDLPESPQDIAGRWNPTAIAQCNTEGLTDSNRIHGGSVYFYNHLYKLDRINANMVQREPIFHDPHRVNNTTGWLGHHRIYNPVTQAWDTIILDDGPFGHNVYKGCISDRDVTGRALREMNFETTCQIFS